MTALILAGGELEPTERLRALAAEADLVIAADGGLRHARALGVTPARIVGDFDSVDAEVLAAWPDLPRERHPEEKDDLDLELAIAAARAAGAERLRLVGTLGGRFDQSLAALLIAARLRAEGLRVALDSGAEEVRLLGADDRSGIVAPAGTRFSLLALGDGARVSVAGARYELERAPLPLGVGLGLSNAVGGSGHADVAGIEGSVALWIAWHSGIA